MSDYLAEMRGRSPYKESDDQGAMRANLEDERSPRP